MYVNTETVFSILVKLIFEPLSNLFTAWQLSVYNVEPKILVLKRWCPIEMRRTPQRIQSIIL